MPASYHLQVTKESWPIAGSFRISREERKVAEVLVLTLSDGRHTGRAECVPYRHYGETPDKVMEQLSAFAERLNKGGQEEAQRARSLGVSARNALDCALWDLAAKRKGTPVWSLLRLPQPEARRCTHTISLNTPEVMAARAVLLAHLPLLKVKLGGPDDAEAIAAVREAAPHSTLIVDANEGWAAATIEEHFAACHAAGVALIEQPLPAGKDRLLEHIPHPVPLCADESFHSLSDLEQAGRRYEAVNIKLEKTGGLSHAVTCLLEARTQGLQVMVGCMLGTSLAMAPAWLLAAAADYVDLDGPVLLQEDRAGGFRYEEGIMHPAAAGFWGD